MTPKARLAAAVVPATTSDMSDESTTDSPYEFTYERTAAIVAGRGVKRRWIWAFDIAGRPLERSASQWSRIGFRGLNATTAVTCLAALGVPTTWARPWATRGLTVPRSSTRGAAAALDDAWAMGAAAAATTTADSVIARRISLPPTKTQKLPHFADVTQEIGSGAS